jgi:sulfoxide reductase heme-binding subunit YedZ
MRAGITTLIIIGAVAALVALGITDQIIPATDEHTLSVRPWVAARALGITAYLLLTIEVAAGVWLSHPRTSGDPRTSRIVFPWHELLSVFTGAFLVLHIVLLAVDPYAGVDWIGAFVPGFSQYRPVPVAIGSVGLYALIITATTAKWTRLLPAGWWLKIHRLSALVWLMAWIHGVTAGTDAIALLPLYLVTGGLVLAGIAHRWWTVSGQAPRTVAGPRLLAANLRRPVPVTAPEETR